MRKRRTRGVRQASGEARVCRGRCAPGVGRSESAGAPASRAPSRPVAMVDYYEEAEEYLENISDDIPLYTNTQDGVFSEGARTAPAPLEANSDLYVNPMRSAWASRRHSQPASGGVASAAARFQGKGGGPLVQPKPLASSLMPQEQAFEIPDLQDGIADLQMDNSDGDDDVDTAEDFGDIPVAEMKSRSKETSPLLQPKNHGSPLSDQSPGLPDNLMSELAFSNNEDRDISPHVIQGLVQIMREGSHEKQKKATIAMCNLCCESQQVRNVKRQPLLHSRFL